MFKSITNLIYHISILVLSATIALSLPYTGKLIADNYLTYWTLIESEKAFLISVEIAVAVLLIMLFNYLVSNWKNRKFSKMARNDMGLVLAAHPKSFRVKKRLKKFNKLSHIHLRRGRHCPRRDPPVKFIKGHGLSQIIGIFLPLHIEMKTNERNVPFLEMLKRHIRGGTTTKNIIRHFQILQHKI